MTQTANFLLGDALVEPRCNKISRQAHQAKVEPRVMKVLLCLVEQQGHVVSRETLLAAAWPHDYASDEALTKAISHLRKALGDDARSPALIETIPKTGYRLLVSAKPAPSLRDKEPCPLDHEHKPPTRYQWQIRGLWAAVLLLLVLLAAQWVYEPPREPVRIQHRIRVMQMPAGAKALPSPPAPLQAVRSAYLMPDNLPLDQQ